MSAFADIFEATSIFLRGKGITPKVSNARKATPAAVEHFRKQTGIDLPESFAVFFTDFADGLEFTWEKSDEVWGMFSIPNLKQLANDRQYWQRKVRGFLDDPNSLNKCTDPAFRADAFEIWRKMESWIPFWDEGNGDHFCVDSRNGQVLYDQHDWFDGFGSLAKDNGIVAGQSLKDFLQSWSQFCFRRNKSLWWGEFGKFGAIRWDPQYFDREFYRGN